jgi:hypothetical protein
MRVELPAASTKANGGGERDSRVSGYSAVQRASAHRTGSCAAAARRALTHASALHGLKLRGPNRTKTVKQD